MAEKWFPILKTGTHKDSIGRSWTFGEADLDKLIKNYDPAKFEAPIVIGHPKQEDPAFGWIEGLKREGGLLFARPKQLDEGFRKLVNEGRFKKISAKMTPDMKLLHVGFFGAYPTSIKDLPTVSLSDQDGDGFEIEFSDDWVQRTIADTFRRIREFIIEKFDPETADDVIPSWIITDLIPQAPVEAPAFANRDEAKEAQEKRSKKYNIGIKEGGHVTKPGEWDDVADDEFLDPVNYRYPCPDADQTRAAASYWGKPKNQEQYTEAERKTINSRLEAKKKKFKIGDYAKKGGIEMGAKNVLKKLFPKAADKIHDIPDEDLETESLMFSEAEVKQQVDEATKRAHEEGKKEGAAEFADQKKKLREQELTAYVDGLIKGSDGKGRPLAAAKKEARLVEFMAQLSDEETIEFSEGEGDAKKTVKTSPLAMMKAILETLPQDITFSEVATGEKDVDPSGEAKDVALGKKIANKGKAKKE